MRKPLKVLGCCVLGYALLWGASALGMLGLSAWARHDGRTGGETVAGIRHFQRVDGTLWRGSAPGPSGYRALAARGVATVVDLRAEDLTPRQLAGPGEAGMRTVRIPVRDGQTPDEAQSEAFLRVVRESDGPVFVHCGAGVGRTGSMAAAYLVRTGQADGRQAALRMLAVGPPSVEQVYYALRLSRDDSDQPPALVEWTSRVLDAPRRIRAAN
ncbi:dual specificity protein phosphatase family protein [Streptomyces sp. NPDC048172]|uniref:phosphatase domain-containing putative toxin n=1 Tax=Streptomyces sp. NPDC048172 TaxID=3365505 RepID=UPI00371A4D2D